MAFKRIELKQMAPLKKRRDFLRIAEEGFSAPVSGLVLQGRERTEYCEVTSKTFRVGYTVTKKIGNAVKRNRVRRRLRAAVAKVLPEMAAKRFDYVVIGRLSTLDRPFYALTRDLRMAVEQIHEAARLKAEQEEDI